MNYNTKAHRDVVANRRRTVASLRARRLTESEIVAALIELRQVNPTTNRPWSAGTVHGDIEALSEEWRAVAAADIRSLQSELLAELDEVARTAWREKDLRVVLIAHKQKCDMLGLNAPTTLQIELPPQIVTSGLLDGIDLKLASLQELNDMEAAVRLAERLRERSQIREHPAGREMLELKTVA